jgi:hypothetical protein
MACIFADGFDWYQGGTSNVSFTGDLGKRWTSLTSSGHGCLVGPAYGRGGVGQGLRMSANAGTIQKAFGSNYTQGILAFAFYSETVSVASRTIAGILDGTTEQISIRTNASSVLTVTRNGTVLATGSTVLSTATWYYIELKFTINNTTGVVELKLNGASEIASTGSLNTRNTANTQWNGVFFNIPASYIYWIDDVVVLDTSTGANTNFLGPVQVVARYPDSNGNYAQWTPNGGSNVGAVSEPYEDGNTSFNQSSTANQIDTFDMQDLPAASGSVHVIQQHTVAVQDGGSARTIRSKLRISGTDYNGSNVNTSASYQVFTQIHDQSPATSAAWTVSEANGLESGYELVS